MHMNGSTYEFDIEDCDVCDVDKLRRFRDLRATWIDWLRGRDAHQIWGQINSLIWDYLLFCTVNQLRKIGVDDENESRGLNGAVLRLFDTGFAVSQAATIRRLVEIPKSNPKWAVISLRRVIEDVRANRDLFTREIYVAYDGLPYDFALVHDTWLSKRIEEGKENKFGGLETKGPNAWYRSQRLHEHFDRLSGKSVSDRSRYDVMSEKWLDHADAFLVCCEPIKIYVDKFVAHAADQSTRSNLPEGAEGVTLAKLEECHKAIYKAAAFVYGHILWEGSYGALPTPQYDHLAGLDKPWALQKDMGAVQDAWDKFATAVEEWEAEDLWPGGEEAKGEV
jgi:hypothetical protein